MTLSPFDGDMTTLDAIIGNLTVNNTLIIYNDGYYSLDGGTTISTDTIGPETQIRGAAAASITITLLNMDVVYAKLIFVSGGGSLTISGSGALSVNNQDVSELSSISGVRTSGSLTMLGGATLKAVGFNSGCYIGSSSAITLTMSEGSRLIGEVTGINSSIMNAGKYGVYCDGNIIVSGGSSITGTGAETSWNTYGVFYDPGHMNKSLHIIDGEVTGIAETGVYAGGPVLVDHGILTGTGGSHYTAHGVQADNTYIVVNQGGQLHGTCGDGAYAGVFAVRNGIEVNGGQITGNGGVHGVRCAGSGNILVTEGGAITGSGSTYGVISLHGITVEDGRLTGTGGKYGVLANENISADNGVVEGFTVTYGLDTSYFGAVIADGSMRAVNHGKIIQNYSKPEFFDETFKLPYQNGKNMDNYLNYSWGISSGTGSVESDPSGSGIHAVQSGNGTLTATRAANVAGEVVALDDTSSHIINIPVVLEAVPMLTVTYNSNGGSGGYVDPGKEFDLNYTILSALQTGIRRTGFTFTGWNTQPDSGGAAYAPGDLITLTDDVTLYAQWAADPVFYTVSYESNGGSGSYTDPDREFELHYIILSTNQTKISRKGFLFTSWNTRPDGSGISYAPGDIITIIADVGLYAQWRQIPEQQRLCRTPTTACRRAIEGQILWVDNDNAGNTRPPSVEIILLRDGEVYKRANVDSAGDGYFGFCCLPVWKNSAHKYTYRIDETAIPGYTVTIEGSNIINTLIP